VDRLTGGSHESYVINILGQVTKASEGEKGGLGWRGCVVNFRGCGGSPITSQQLYHGGYTVSFFKLVIEPV
jgi:predicted alpha/beta-fold hydrolase